jgi:hypothetical protein
MATNPSSTVHAADGLESSWENDPLNYVIRAYIAFLQTVFETADRGCFHWSPQLEETELVITEESPVNLDAIEQKPAMSVLLGPTRFNGSSLDDLVNVKTKNAEEIHTDLIPGTITINCLSRVAHECRFLAWQAARHMWILRKLFVRETHIHEANRNIQIGAVSPAGALATGDTEAEWLNVPVQAPFFLQWTDRVLPLTHDWSGRPIHTLQKVGMAFATRMSGVQSSKTFEQTTGLETGAPAWGTMAEKARVNQKIRRSAVLKPPGIRGKTIVREPEPGSTSIPVTYKTKV